MSSNGEHENFPDTLDYALNALSRTQRAAFESWASAEQKQQAHHDAQALALLGSSLEPVAAPAELKARVMDQIARTEQLVEEPKPEQLRGGERSAAQAQHTAPPTKSTVGEDAIPPGSARARAARAWFGRDGIASPARVLAAACAVLALTVGAWGFVQHQQLQQATTELQAARAASSSQLQTAQQQAQSIVDQISTAPDLSLARGKVNGMPVSVMYSPSHNMAGVSTTNLPALPNGKVYMVWLYDVNGNIVGSGTLDSAGRGAGVTTFTGHDLSHVTDFGISVEDENATAPSQKPAMLDNMV